jgi:hypothetical protein
VKEKGRSSRAVLRDLSGASRQILEQRDRLEVCLHLAQGSGSDREMTKVVAARGTPEALSNVRRDRNRRTPQLGSQPISFNLGKLPSYAVRFHE